MLRAVLWSKGALWRGNRRSLAMSIELDAIAFHVGVDAKFILRIAHSGEDRKAGSGKLHTRGPATRFWTELLIADLWSEADLHIEASIRHQSKYM